MTAQPAPRPFCIVERPFFTDAEKQVNGDFSIDPQAALTFFDTGPGWKFECGELIHDVTQRPATIFGNLQRENYADAFCYCGIPPHRFGNNGELVEMPDDEVFLGFCVLRDEELQFFDWEFRDVDPWKPGFPDGWELDLGEPLWKQPPKPDNR